MKIKVSEQAKVIYQKQYLLRTDEQIAFDMKCSIQGVKNYCLFFESDEKTQTEIKKTILPRKWMFEPVDEVEVNHCVYVINGFDEKNRFVTSKIGYTNNFNRRRKELLKANDWAKIEIKHLFVFDDEDDARGFENVVRKYYKNLYGIENWIPKDRFTVQMLDSDLSDLIEQYENYKAFCGC